VPSPAVIGIDIGIDIGTSSSKGVLVDCGLYRGLYSRTADSVPARQER
jgi:sugar (pentulose or hexulose) kinase